MELKIISAQKFSVSTSLNANFSLIFFEKEKNRNESKIF